MAGVPRAATQDELNYLRSSNQSARLYLTIHAPTTIYSARLAAVPSTTDRVAAVTYNNGSGSYTSILADHTLLIGSSAGTADYGMARIRTTSGLGASSGTFNIGETSSVNWQANAYLTVLDEFIPWPRHPRIVGTAVYMDYDVAYSDQHSKCDSVPVMGPCYVAWLHGSTVTITPDGSQSWALNNSITAYAWDVPGSVSSSGTTTATPTITYDAVGTYRIGLAITNSDGRTFTGYRYVFVVNDITPPLTRFTLTDCSGDYQSGGWSFSVTLHENADRSTIRDRAFVVLHAREWYGDTEISLGYVTGCENIIACGWIDGETINWQPENLPGAVSFEVKGAQAWLDRMPSFPSGLKNTTSAPTTWTRFQGLTAKSVTWHLLRWRSTLTRCIDVFPCANQLAAARLEAPGAQSLWTQIQTILDQTIMARACADRYSRLHFQRDQNLLTTSERSSVPTVMTLTASDWTGQIEIERRTLDEVSAVDLSGVSLSSNIPMPIFSLSPGRVYNRHGRVVVKQRLVLSDQATSNTLAGLLLGALNNQYPRLSIELASNNRLIDIAPYQYITCPINIADTPRGLNAPTLKIIPRRMRLSFRDGVLLTSLEAEGETTARMAVDGDQPANPIAPPIAPPISPPPVIPPPIPVPAADGKEMWISHYDATSTPNMALIYSTNFFSSPGSPTWAKVAALPSGITSIIFHWQPPDGSYIYLYGMDQNGKPAIWYSSNPKSGSPTWTLGVSTAFTIRYLNDGTPVNFKQIDALDPDAAYPLALVSTDRFDRFVGQFVLSVQVTSPTAFTCYGPEDGNPQGLYNTWPTGAGAIRGVNIMMPNDYVDRWPNMPNSRRKYPGFNGTSASIYGEIGGLTAFSGSGSRVISTLVVNSIVPRYTLEATTFTHAGANFTSGGYLSAGYGYDFFNSRKTIYWTEDNINWRRMNTDYYWGGNKVRSAKRHSLRYVIWGVLGATANSNEFMRHCPDISDPANNPWTADVGNMWTGIITAGPLNIKNFTIVYG